MNNNSSAFAPFMLALMLAGGILIGFMISGNAPENRELIRASENDKIGQIISLIDEKYVDTVNTHIIVERAIDEILEDLDPHSDYIPSSELQGLSESLDGEFEGIGVEFTVNKDTVIVINPVDDGPSQKVGIQPGDRIVEVDGENIAGVGISNERVIELLKGPSNTEVTVQILRKGKEELLPFTIKRGVIPIKSVSVALPISETVGYVKLVRFARTTVDEFKDAMNKLNASRLKHLIVDLRGNGGGYLQTAVDLADEFLPENTMVVYTQGKAQKRKNYPATSKGKLEEINVIILIDEGSASASEVLAGAIQDNDRGTIIGRRSFGKGLVQDQLYFDDLSALRLTIARYYTPTGRSIQKPYGEGIDYQNDYFSRLENGELLYADSISFPDSLKFITPKGKVVYGGGGIMPDIFVGIDTTGGSEYFSQININGLINRYAFNYADKHRESLNSFGSYHSFLNKFTLDDKDIEAFHKFAENNGVTGESADKEISQVLIHQRIKAFIARNIWNNEGFFSVLLQDDKVFEAALAHITKNEAKSTG